MTWWTSCAEGMDAIKATDADLNLMDSRKNCEENKREIQTRRSKATRRSEERGISYDDEGWAEALLRGENESASGFSVPVLLKPMAHSVKGKDFQDWKQQVKVKISLCAKERNTSHNLNCKTPVNTQNIYRNGNKSLLPLLRQCNPLCKTSKVKERGCRLALGVSLEMRPWVCLNPATAERELEAKPKRPWITACERRGVCVKVNPWSMQMSLGPSDSSWIWSRVVWNFTVKCFVEERSSSSGQSARTQSGSRHKGMMGNQFQWTFKMCSLSF